MFRHRRPAARSRKPIRLLLESLEERLTPSGGNPTVTQTAGGYTALTKAVAADTASNTNYVIQITGNFTFNSGGQVSISKLGSGSSLILEGQNGTNFALTGNGNRLFSVASGQNVTFADLTLTGGSVANSKGNAQGGAILDQGGSVTLSKVTVKGNTVTGATAEGGGVYASGAGTLVLRDSILSDNSAQGAQGADGTAPGGNGASGGSAYGGGLYVAGSGWTATMIGDTLSDNTAIGGNGGNGAAGPNASGSNAQAGGDGGDGGYASGGAAYFSNSGSSGGLTILNDPSAPLTHPSTWIDNSAQAGAGGNGGAGGNATGTASDGPGGQGGGGGTAFGGALYVTSFAGAAVRIGNSAFYDNKAAGGNGGTSGLPGTGGQPSKVGPSSLPGGDAVGGGLYFSADNVTIVNSTVAANTAIGGNGQSGGTEYPGGFGSGGGISLQSPPIHDPPAPTPPSPPTSVFVNNTITQNTVVAGEGGSNGLVLPEFNGAGVLFVGSSNATLLNNLIQGNGIGLSAVDLDFVGATLNASNNFIGTMSTNAVSMKTNIVGNTQAQLGNAVGVDAKGNPTGGPIYYPLLSGVVSIGAGSSSALNIIAGVEGTTAANATDQIGNLRSSNGLINLGTVEIPPPPPSPPSSPPAPPVLNVPPLLAFLDSLLGGVETVNGNGTETITDSFFGIPLIVSTFDSSGNLMSVDLFGFFNITFLFA